MSLRPPLVSGPIAVQATGSRLDDLWQRLMAHPGARRAWHWGGPASVTVLALILRLVHLGFPHQLIFDETYYVKDAWSLGHLGYEGSWPSNANGPFTAGHLWGYTPTGSFVAHPPLGKWVIYLGMQLTGGAASSFAWRFSVALAGTATVLLVALIARRLFSSTLLGTIAGGLLAIDGLSITMSRTALLDGIIPVFVLLGFWAILLDRDWSRSRLAAGAASEHPNARVSGIIVLWRPWLIAAGIAFGAATAVKWSGLYFLAVFGVYTVLDDALARHRYGIRGWWSGTILQGCWNAILLVPIALVTYLAAWSGWLVTHGGYNRTATEHATGIFALLPQPLQNLWSYQVAQYQFSINLHTPHPWASNPLTWPLALRPTLFYRTQTMNGVHGCTTPGGCISTISALPNPIIWWCAHAAIIVLLIVLIRRRSWRAGIILAGFAAGYLPWLLYLNRTVFMFYAVAWEPFLILALTAVIGMVLGTPALPRRNRTRRLAIVAGFGALVIGMSAFFWPLWTGTSIPMWLWQLHSWLPGTWQ